MMCLAYNIFQTWTILFFVIVDMTLTNLQDSVVESERNRYDELLAVIGWFFFDLFVLRYVEDSNTGLSFRLPGGLEWAIYIEVRQYLSPCKVLSWVSCRFPLLLINQKSRLKCFILKFQFCSCWELLMR